MFNRLLHRYRMHFHEDSYALDELDRKLKPYLNFRNGFFVEAGANDGVSQSNTLYFEKYRNWRGLLVEPVPDLAEACRVNRPGCLVENCALVPFEFKAPTIEMRYCNLMSLVKGAMKSEADELAHVRTGCEIQGIQSYSLMVPARTLSAVLDQHDIRRIDFLSLDVEGFELNALRGLDFSRHRPSYMLIEARFRAELDQFLEGWYEPLAELSHHDVLYRTRSGWQQ